MTDHVFLVPGFFGFSSFGRLKYFNGVGEIVQRELERTGMRANVVEIDTLPTASIRRRAGHLLEKVRACTERDPGPVHLIGHSTGGLDVRLLVCPNADLQSQVQQPVLERVRTLVTVATPHLGTPLANSFSGAFGRPALKLFAILMFYVLQYGRLPVGIGLQAARWVTRLDDYVGLKNTVPDEIFEKLLGELGTEERQQLLDFLDGVGNDQSLLFQLTEAGCDLLNATTGRPDWLRYASVLTCAPRANLRNVWENSVNVYAQGLHGIYGALYMLARRTDTRWLPTLSSSLEEALLLELGRVPDARDNDGIVPTLAQTWGEHLGAVRADHLDVIGHFGDDSRGAGADWFPSGSNFGYRDFEALWRRVADYIARTE